MKITKEMTIAAYSVGKKVFERGMTRQDAINHLTDTLGMSKGSAGDFITNFQHLVNGKKYTRTLNEYSTDYFLENIRNDFDYDIYGNAIAACQKHVEYYESIPKGARLHGIQDIIDKHERILKSILENIQYIDNEEIYQKEVLKSNQSKINDSPQKKKESKNINGNNLYHRNPSHAKQSIIDAGYSCEISPNHKTFIPKYNSKQFTEAHHLIPLRYHGKFSVSLDVPANIITELNPQLSWGEWQKLC